MQKDVAILLRIGGATGRNILAGILKRIKDRDNCTIRIASDADDFQRLASSASALISDMSADVATIQTAITYGKPVVLLNDWRIKEHPANLGHIRTDDGEIGFKAADYLLSLGKFRTFGYVPAHTDREWSVKRGRAFQLRLRRNGCECCMFNSSASEDGALGTWLKGLSKPAAVFCAWDAVAADVAFAARKAKVKIPSQVVLLGVDNDELFAAYAELVKQAVFSPGHRLDFLRVDPVSDRYHIAFLCAERLGALAEGIGKQDDFIAALVGLPGNAFTDFVPEALLAEQSR